MSWTSIPVREATWTERGATFAVFLALGFATGAWAASLPALKATLGLSNSQLSFALLGVAAGSVIATVAAGVVTPRIGSGRATALGALALAVAIALPSIAQNLPQFVAAAAAFGIANGFLDVSMNGHASDVERRWGQAIMSSLHGAFSLGGLLGAVFGGLLATVGFGSTGQLAIPACIVGVLALGAATNLGPGVRGTADALGVAWPTRAVLGLSLIALFSLVIEGAIADWSAVYLATVVRVSDGAAAAGYAGFSVAMTIGRLTGDRVVRVLGPRMVVAGGGVITALGLAAAVAVPSLVSATVGFALVGLGMANIVPTVFSAAGRFGRTPAAGMAMVVSVGYVGYLTGPPLIGGIAAVSSLRMALSTMVLAGVAIAVIGFIMKIKPSPDRR